MYGGLEVFLLAVTEQVGFKNIERYKTINKNNVDNKNFYSKRYTKQKTVDIKKLSRKPIVDNI